MKNKNNKDEILEIHLDALESSEEISLERLSNDDPIVTLVRNILASALKQNASFIETEIFRDCYRFRYKINGKLMTEYRPPIKLYDVLISEKFAISRIIKLEHFLQLDSFLKITRIESPATFETLPLLVFIIVSMESKYLLRILVSSSVPFLPCLVSLSLIKVNPEMSANKREPEIFRKDVDKVFIS